MIRGKRGNLAKQRARAGFKGDFGYDFEGKGDLEGKRRTFSKGEKGVKWDILQRYKG